MTDATLVREESANRKLYQEGVRYLKKLTALPQGTRYHQATLKPVAEKYATSVAEVRTAVEFVVAVNQIAQVAGASAKKLLLSERSLLTTPVLITQSLCKLPPDRLRAALQNAQEGLHPLAREVPKDTPPDLVKWDYYLHRLKKASSLLTQNELLRPASSLKADETKAVYREATATRTALSALLLALQSFGGSRHRPSERATPAWEPEVPLLKALKKARGEVHRITHDLPLALAQHPLSPLALGAFRSAAAGLCDWASRAVEHTRPLDWPPPSIDSLVRDHSQEPDTRPGTYIMVLHSEQPVVRRIGRLETFWLPEGYYLYVGSACGSGGVAARTSRHGRSDACRMWNLDHAKAFARPVEVWWTYHSGEEEKKVECPWALALAELPDYFCPAPGFGSHCENRCPAHFYHTLRRPSCKAFAAVVGQEVSGHGPIYRHRFA